MAEIKPWGLDVGVKQSEEQVLGTMSEELGLEFWSHGQGLGQEDAQYDFETEDEAIEAATKIRTWLRDHGYDLWVPDGDFWDPNAGAVVVVFRNEEDEDHGLDRV
jgi:hypothetical protein